jgi:fatty-acyl-CoA synthase
LSDHAEPSRISGDLARPSSAGIVVALINTELRGHSLAHCIHIVAPKHVIVAAACATQFADASTRLISGPAVWTHGESDAGPTRIDAAIKRYSDEAPAAADLAPVTIADRALLIYTSGTTGLPKAANVSHRRLLQWSFFRRIDEHAGQ